MRILSVGIVRSSDDSCNNASFSGFFRDDRFKAADFVTGTVLPYSNQQLSTTIGGPILRNKLHFFWQLRIRERTEHHRFPHRVPQLQLGAAGKSDSTHGWHAPGLSGVILRPRVFLDT